MGQRLKFYGWGNEGEGLDMPERERLFRFVSDKLGVEPRLSAPPQASDIALRAPRVSSSAVGSKRPAPMRPPVTRMRIGSSLHTTAFEMKPAARVPTSLT